MRAIVTALLLAGACLAQEAAYMGEVTSDRVRVRGGPGDYHAVIKLVDSGTPVRVLGVTGDWLAVEIPGGIPAYVSKGRDGRPFVREQQVGRTVVLVNDLQVRGDASTDYPPIGEVMAGQDLVVLDDQGGWLRILAPARIHAHIHKSLVRRAADQEQASKAFAVQHLAVQKALLESGAASTQLVEVEAAAASRKLRADEAFRMFEIERRKEPLERDVAGVREVLTAVVSEGPEDHPFVVRARGLLATVDDWDAMQVELGRARERLAQARREADQAEQRYADELQKVAREVTEDRRAPAKPEYITSGWVRRNFPVGGIVASGSPYGVYQGGVRLFAIESDRYDLGEYSGLLVGVIEAKGPETRAGQARRVLDVSRLEILSSP